LSYESNPQLTEVLRPGEGQELKCLILSMVNDEGYDNLNAVAQDLGIDYLVARQLVWEINHESESKH